MSYARHSVRSLLRGWKPGCSCPKGRAVDILPYLPPPDRTVVRVRCEHSILCRVPYHDVDTVSPMRDVHLKGAYQTLGP